MRASELAEHHHNLGGAHKIAGRLEEAEIEFRRALELDPRRATTKYALGITLLGMGRYSEGFPLYEYRHEVPEFRNVKPNLPFREWMGEDVRGKKIAIWPEQGFGDQIQMARFAPILKHMGADVTLLCSPALKRLFDLLEVNVVAASGSVEFPDPDGWVMAGSIAGRLGVTLGTVPSKPYLTVPHPISCRPRPSIGLVTRGNPLHANDAHRSLPSAMSDRLRSLPASIVSLHPEDSGAKDFRDTADIISKLDIVISVDTAVAHLAGAMGTECWTLVPLHNSDWRWGIARRDTPWYDSMRIFQQHEIGNWIEPIKYLENAFFERFSS